MCVRVYVRANVRVCACVYMRVRACIHVGVRVHVAVCSVPYCRRPSRTQSDGAYFNTSEGLAFLARYTAGVKAVDAGRVVSWGLASPRLRAAHIAALPAGGGRACVTPANPHGDCELCADDIAAPDSREDTAGVLRGYYGGAAADMVGSHFYSCAPPYGNYTWCGPASEENTTLAPLALFKSIADEVSGAFGW